MSNSKVSIQFNNNKLNTTTQENLESTFINRQTLSLHDKLGASDSIELNGEEFVILPVNGRNPAFASLARPKPAPGSHRVSAFKKSNHTENEIESAASMALIGALFPISGILEHLKHMSEVVHKLQEDSGRLIHLSSTQNINPKAALDPNKAHLPTTPFAMPLKPMPEMWQQKRQKMQEELESKKKKKVKGLSGF